MLASISRHMLLHNSRLRCPAPQDKTPQAVTMINNSYTKPFRYYQFCIHAEAFLGLTLILSGLPSGQRLLSPYIVAAGL